MRAREAIAPYPGHLFKHRPEMLDSLELDSEDDEPMDVWARCLPSFQPLWLVRTTFPSPNATYTLQTSVYGCGVYEFAGKESVPILRKLGVFPPGVLSFSRTTRVTLDGVQETQIPRWGLGTHTRLNRKDRDQRVQCTDIEVWERVHQTGESRSKVVGAACPFPVTLVCIWRRTSSTGRGSPLQSDPCYRVRKRTVPLISALSYVHTTHVTRESHPALSDLFDRRGTYFSIQEIK